MPNPVLGPGGFHHVALRTADWDRTLSFYRDVLGCDLRVAWGAPGERAAMLDVGDGDCIEVFEDAQYQAAPNGRLVHFALRTGRIDAVTERVRAAGYLVTMEPRDLQIQTTNGRGALPVRLSFCEGPNGEVIEFLDASRL